YEILLTMITLFLQGCCITLWTLMLLWYGQTGCTLHQTLISLTIVSIAVSLIVTHGSIFVTAIVSLYGTYLCYSGIQSNPQKDYNDKNINEIQALGKGNYDDLEKNEQIKNTQKINVNEISNSDKCEKKNNVIFHAFIKKKKK
ncbi:hypothetical protein RFI_40322, partial [Reticulomyxa filosa]